MRARERRRAIRWRKYAGDYYGLRTLEQADLKAREVNKRVRAMQKEERNENKRVEKEVSRLLRENKKAMDRYYEPKH